MKTTGTTLFILIAFVWSTISQEKTKDEIPNSVQPALKTFEEYPKVRDFTLSVSGKEAYVTIQSPLEDISVIVNRKLENEVWLKPEITGFSGKYKDLEPFLSPDNRRLYFASNRPVYQNDSLAKDFDIWYVEREESGSEWSDPINVGGPVNTNYDEFYPSVSTNGNLYFTRNSPETVGEDDIFFSEYKDGGYAVPVMLSQSINSEGYEFNSYIAPDESYLIFSGYDRKDGFGSGDLYISQRDGAGNWSNARNLGNEINSKYMDYCPFVHPESQTLYFTSTRSAARPDEFKSMDSLYNQLNIYENGLSRIYKAPFPLKSN